MNEYLEPTEFLDCDEPTVCGFAARNSSAKKSSSENAVWLYYAVRDGFTYNLYTLDLRREGLKASNLVNRKSGSAGGEREMRRHYPHIFESEKYEREPLVYDLNN